MKEDLEQPIESDIDFEGFHEDPWEKWVSSMWTDKGYDAGILAEDAPTPTISISNKAEHAKNRMEKAVALRYEILAAQEEAALASAMDGYDSAVICKAAELKGKYNELMKSYNLILEEYNELEDRVGVKRKRRNSLRYQNKHLDKAIAVLEQDIVEKMNKTTEAILARTIQIENLEKELIDKSSHETIVNLDI